ncbi:MAG: zinc dependent phospholipase C family protein [Acidobacteriaceae bacterium]|nr:zinc dependent phospholipase C family protein [Acidobacteriaceae bacterium]MBV9779447.1 zinc dependent phospholipase C family protein [Acidobacteriaceae bacterium]
MALLRRAGFRGLIAVCLPLLAVKPAPGYSVLSHEAMIDALWDVQLKPTLLARFPSATPEQLKEAHGYAYGGAIIQDIGFYPHGNGYFSDLTHYALAGDFIIALISESQNLNELAFALGALSHYFSDNDGHRLATNIAEPLLYPKLRRKFGDVITYEDMPRVHLQTEFGFDVLEVAKGNFAPQAYHDFIGFNVARPVLERAFRDTYGFDLGTMFQDFDGAIGSYRHAVSKTVPTATRVAWAQRESEIRRIRPSITRREFVYIMRRSSYEREWGKRYDRPTFGDYVLAFFLKLVPPIGPLKALRFKMPTPQVEQIFMRSFEAATAGYRSRLSDTAGGNLQLANTNFDLGRAARPGEYRLQDDTYAYWLHALAEDKFSGVTPRIGDEILGYYSNFKALLDTKKDKENWRRVLTELDELKATRAALGANGRETF